MTSKCEKDLAARKHGYKDHEERCEEHAKRIGYKSHKEYLKELKKCRK
mgnify:CR=1 FL=1